VLESGRGDDARRVSDHRESRDAAGDDGSRLPSAIKPLGPGEGEIAKVKRAGGAVRR
jgi:hypothetical protein